MNNTTKGASSDTTSTSPSIPVVLRRQTRVYRNGKANVCITVPKDIADMWPLTPGNMLLMEFTMEGRGSARLELADAVGSTGAIGGGK